HGCEQSLPVLREDEGLNIAVFTRENAAGIHPNANGCLAIPRLASVLIAEQASGATIDTPGVDLEERHINVLAAAQSTYTQHPSHGCCRCHITSLIGHQVERQS